MTGWLFWQVPADIAAFSLIVVACVFGTFGVWSVLHVHAACGGWLSPGKRAPDAAFEWWLGGCFLIDAAIYLVLAFSVALGDGGIDLWALGLTGAIGWFAAMAMRWFGHARLKERA